MTPQPRKSRQPWQSRQRKMTSIDIEETSGVDRPAHGVEGWLIAKSADQTPASREQLRELFGSEPIEKAAEQPSEDLPPGAFSLKEHERHLVRKHLDALKPGDEVEFRPSGKGARLGKSPSGEPYLTTPASIAKAAGEEWARAKGIGPYRPGAS